MTTITMRPIVHAEFDHHATIVGQRYALPASELHGRHSPGKDLPLLPSGQLRVREGHQPWASDGIGHHRAEGEPRMTNAGCGARLCDLIGDTA